MILGKIEEKIINYADKLVRHNEIVSLKERFEDLRRRYNHRTDEETKIGEKNCFEIEKEIFKKIGIKPEDLKKVIKVGA